MSKSKIAAFAVVVAAVAIRMATSQRAQPAQQPVSPTLPDLTSPGAGGNRPVPRDATQQGPGDAKVSRTGRINGIAAAIMFVATIGMGAWIPIFWPDTSGPPAVGPTIGGLRFSVDTPDVDGAVRVLINPDAKNYTGGPPGLMIVDVFLDVPEGVTVNWALDLGAVEESIKLEPLRESGDQRPSSGELVHATVTYDMPSPKGRVRDHLIVGQTVGPSSAYSLLASQTFLTASGFASSSTGLSWDGPLPAVFQGPYMNVVMPSLTAVHTGEPGSRFNLGWKPVSLHQFNAIERLALSGDYQITAGNATPLGLMGWNWSTSDQLGIINASGMGTSAVKQAEMQNRLFISGILIGIGGSIFLGAIQCLIVFWGERRGIDSVTK